jgi:hypothetical protein
MQEAPAPATRVPARRSRPHQTALSHVHGFSGVDQDGALHQPLLGKHRQPGALDNPFPPNFKMQDTFWDR